MTTNTLEQPDFADLTQAFIDKAEGSDVIAHLIVKAGLDLPTAVAWTVEVQANGCVGPTSTRGQEAERLSAWHREVSQSCSDLYQDLRMLHPDTTREEINTNPELMMLNAVRRGLRSAMGASYTRVSSTRTRQHRRP